MNELYEIMHVIKGRSQLIFLSREDKARIKLPRDMEDAKGLGKALSNYTDEYFTQVMLGFVVIYILYPFTVLSLSTSGRQRGVCAV